MAMFRLVFSTADVNANRTVTDRTSTRSRPTRVSQSLLSNFRDDINLSGVVDIPDKNAVSANRGHHIP